MEFPFIQTAVRLAVPFTILRFPLFGILLSSFVDIHDWSFSDVSTPEKSFFYQKWDKSLDTYYQFFILFVVLRFKDDLVKKTAVALFVYRILGVLLFYLTDIRQFLLFFPNLFENFVILYLLFVLFSGKQIMLTSKKLLAVVLTVVAVPKIIHEYFQHYLLKHPWEVYDIGEFLMLTDTLKEYIFPLLWGALLHALPILIAVYFLKMFHSASPSPHTKQPLG